MKKMLTRKINENEANVIAEIEEVIRTIVYDNRGLWDLPHHFDDADGEVNRRSADGTGWTHGHTSLGY